MAIKELDIESPHEDVQIGTVLDYSAKYINGYLEGKSPVKRIYVDAHFDEDSGERLKFDKDFVWAVLENGKCVFLGYEVHKEDGSSTIVGDRKYIKF
jgi:hypothetical protein